MLQLFEHRSVGCGHAEHLTYDMDRQREDERADEAGGGRAARQASADPRAGPAGFRSNVSIAISGAWISIAANHGITFSGSAINLLSPDKPNRGKAWNGIQLLLAAAGAQIDVVGGGTPLSPEQSV